MMTGDGRQSATGSQRGCMAHTPTVASRHAIGCGPAQRQRQRQRQETSRRGGAEGVSARWAQRPSGAEGPGGCARGGAAGEATERRCLLARLSSQADPALVCSCKAEDITVLPNNLTQ